MVRSYDEIYLEQVSETIGTMFEYAIELGYNEVDFWNLFVYSDVVKEIERGNPKYLAGLSAIELLENVLKVVGQETNLGLFLNKPQFFNISLHTGISSVGSSDRDTLIVSPIPCLNKTPKPILDFIVPEKAVPASVIPKCSGYLKVLAAFS